MTEPNKASDKQIALLRDHIDQLIFFRRPEESEALTAVLDELEQYHKAALPTYHGDQAIDKSMLRRLCAQHGLRIWDGGQT